jgi:hypothetical protein
LRGLARQETLPYALFHVQTGLDFRHPLVNIVHDAGQHIETLVYVAEPLINLIAELTHFAAKLQQLRAKISDAAIIVEPRPKSYQRRQNDQNGQLPTRQFNSGLHGSLSC